MSSQTVSTCPLLQTDASGAATNARWFVAQTQPHREGAACAQLQAQGFQVFLPRITKTIRHARKLRTIHAPLFPSYVFVSMRLDKDAWRSVNGTYGVSRMIMAGERPAPVPVGVVESFEALVDEAGCVQLGAGLQVGQQIEIVAGPFAEAIGTLQRQDANGRVRVLLNIMGGRVPAIVDRADLRAA